MIAAILLIAAGLVLLANNLGVVDWSVWRALAKLWPLILIGVGLDLMFGNRRLVSLLVGLVVLSLLGVGLVFFDRGQVEISSMQVSVPREEATQASLHIKAGLAALELRSGAAEGMLLEGQVEFPEGEPVELNTHRKGQAQQVRLSQTFRGLGRLFWREREPKWNLLLPGDLPLDLDVHTGMGSARLDLGALSLRQLEVESGVGHTRIVLPARGRYSAKIEGGIGHVEILIPRDFPVRVEAHAGLGSVHVSGTWSRYEKHWSSPGFEQAASGVDLEIVSGVGSVEVKQVGTDTSLSPAPSVTPQLEPTPEPVP